MNRGAVELSRHGLAKEQLLEEIRRLQEQDANWKGGKTWSLVYYGGEEITDLLKEAYLAYFHGNALNPLAFPGLRKLENEVTAMTAALLGGGTEARGSLTSGGTESILMAVKTARDLAGSKRPLLDNPEMVVPISAHPAFLKAAHYLGVKTVCVPVGPDFRAEIDAVRSAVNDNTVLIVGSAPSYPQGVIDPIEELAALALEKGICCHVDACLGGFMLPFIERLGYPVTPFDFRVPGVSSISADLHKYGFAAKGASAIVYRDKDLRRYQYFALADWPGGLFGSPTMTGTRPGGTIAAAWAVMKFLGEEGYLKLAGMSMDSTRALMEGISAIDELQILGKPAMSVFSFGSASVDINLVGDAMEARGWHMDLQQNPSCLHLMVTPAHTGVVDQFLNDLQESVDLVKAGKVAPSGLAAMYGMIRDVPKENAENFILDFFNDLYSIE